MVTDRRGERPERRMAHSMRRVIAVLAATIVTTGAAAAAELKVMSSNPLREVLPALVGSFEQASGHKVTIVWGGTEAIAKRVADGEAADIVLVAAPNVDRLIAAGRLQAGSRRDVARSGVGVAVRAGAPRPDISSAEAVKQAVLAADSVMYSSGPSGFYVAEMLRKLGIAEEVKAKVKQPPSGVQVGELVARGEAALGFQQISELVHVKGIDYLGPLPPEIQNVTIYAAGIHVASAAPAAAEAFLVHLRSPAAADLVRKAGMDPG